MLLNGKPCAVAAIDAEGNASIGSTARVFYTASGSSSSPPQPVLCNTTFAIAPPHIVYTNARLTAGLSSFPTTRGHTIAILKQSPADLFSLERDNFIGVMLGVSKVAAIIRKFYDVGRCALVTEGSDSLSLLPLYGLSQEFRPITSSLKEFHELFPGYVSSKDGPQMDGTRLDDVCSAIQTSSGISHPHNFRFEGDLSDDNLFARIVRGELSQWRVWEDDRHIAFLTPFANTPGFTVLVPRAHLSSDIFSLDAESYSELVSAAYTVVGILKRAFGVNRCGMIFEGFEIDYAHVKLIPIHQTSETAKWSSSDCSGEESAFEERYQGYVTSLNGPRTKNVQSLVHDTLSIRKLFKDDIAQPPQS